MTYFNLVNSNTTSNNISSFYGIFNRKVFCFLLLLVLTLSLSSLMSRVVLAEKPIGREKTVISILIQPGDTLWSIANEYYSEEYEDLTSYIDEIKTSNGLSSDKIHSGNYILIPLYNNVEE